MCCWRQIFTANQDLIFLLHFYLLVKDAMVVLNDLTLIFREIGKYSA